MIFEFRCMGKESGGDAAYVRIDVWTEGSEGSYVGELGLPQAQWDRLFADQEDAGEVHTVELVGRVQ